VVVVLGFAPHLLAADPDPASVTFFETKIRPILVQRCYACHSAGATKLRGGLRLDSRAGWIKGGDSGPAIEPDSPEKSTLIRAVKYRDPALQMPPKGMLPVPEISALEEWVRMGAPDPRGEPAIALPSRPRTIDIQAGRKHWAFQPLRQGSPPEVHDPGWCRNPIDRFVLSAIESRRFSPSPPTDRHSLIRRLTLDLTGLPPTHGELEAFLKDSDPQAAEHLVERLLASPQHGERWARHWLDLARFAESHGFEHDTDRPSAYPYRDFVIRSLNRDLPFDRFTALQIAGDELAPDDRLAVAATGFLAAGVHSTQITANQVEKERYDELDDMASTVGTAFLGLTIGCARCHDHKYDPIPQRDYYRLLATFTTTVRTEVDLTGTNLAATAPTKPKPGALMALICSEGLPPQRLNSQGPDFFAKTHFLQRGDPNRKQGEATQGFLQVLMNAPEQERRWQSTPPPGWRTSYRRKALASWLTDADWGAGALLARVIVNRLWQHHFGRGLVATPSDFGTQGAAPSHPELLDWLAAELIRNNWRLKPIHRLIVTSATYRQSSAIDPGRFALDPEDRWLWHYPRRRLEAEAIRDLNLAVSGRLDRRMFGPGSLDEDHVRRSLYFTVKRSRLIPMMVLFDAPDALQGLAVRSSTTIAPQSLLLMNSPAVRLAAAEFARQILPSRGWDLAVPDHQALKPCVVRAYEFALAREPSSDELQDALAFLKAQAESPRGDGQAAGIHQAFTDFCQVVLSLSEFLDIP
jgi:hypothetical protein